MERDDLIVNDSYALNSHHSEEEGAKRGRYRERSSCIFRSETQSWCNLGGPQ